MRIFILSNHFPEHIGGEGSIANTLCQAYRSAGHEVRWAAADVKDDHHTGDIPLRAWDITEQRLGFPYPLLLPSAVLAIMRGAAWADVIHIHDALYLSSQFGCLAGKLFGKPVLMTQHIGLVPYSRASLRILQKIAYATIGRLILSFADQVVFYSPMVQEQFASFVRYRRPPLMIDNGIDTTLFHPGDEGIKTAISQNLGLPDKPLILFAGRFVEKKGLALLRQVAEINPQWHFVLVGRVDNIDPSRWGNANVTVLSARPQSALPELYQSADCFLLPSSGEGFPVSVQEAVACGTPAVIEDSLAAITFAPGVIGAHLDAQSLSQAITRALTLALDRNEVAAWVENNWSASVAARAYIKAMESIGHRQSSAGRSHDK